MIFLIDAWCSFFPKLFRDNKPLHILFLTIRDYSFPIANDYSSALLSSWFLNQAFRAIPLLSDAQTSIIGFLPPFSYLRWFNWFISVYRERWTLVVSSSTPRRSVGRPTHTHAARRSPVRLRNEPSLFITGQSVQQHSQVILIISLVTSPHSVTSFVLISSPHPAGSSVNHGCVFGTGIPTQSPDSCQLLDEVSVRKEKLKWINFVEDV